MSGGFCDMKPITYHIISHKFTIRIENWFIYSCFVVALLVN